MPSTTDYITRTQHEFIPKVENIITPGKVTMPKSYSKIYNVGGYKPDPSKPLDWNKINKGFETVGNIADAVPRKQSEDWKINTANQAYDTASSAVAAVPVVGTAISAGMKGVKAIEGLAGSDFGIKHTGKGGFWGQHNKMSDSTWSLLTASGWINRFTKTKVEGSDTDLAKNIRGYSATEVTPQEEIGGFSQSMAKFWSGKDLIGEAKKRRDRVNKENLAKNNATYIDTQNQILAQNNMTNVYNKNKQILSGGIYTNPISAKNGTKINPALLRNIVVKVKNKKEEVILENNVEKFQEGGTLNVIPGGALHARKNDLPKEIKDQVTGKGIPVVTFDDGGEITQHAEIEVNEIIFSLETTKELERFYKDYDKAESDEEKNRIAIECGKFLSSEILENTDDKTGLINTIE